MNHGHIASVLPTHTEILTFFLQHFVGSESAHAIVPSGPNRLPKTNLLYPSPCGRNRPYCETGLLADRLIFSLTPTDGVYAALRSGEKHERSVLFLHRPWELEKKRLPLETLVLYNHAQFDERLTTGWNEAFAALIGMEKNTQLCMEGYKNDPSRKVGLVGQLQTSSAIMGTIANRVSGTFGGHEVLVLNGSATRPVRVIACLNAFNFDIIWRVVNLLREQDWGAPPGVLCITGAARQAGLKAAEKHGMAVLVVGHRRAEMWGLRYLAEQARLTFGASLTVHVVDEEERES